MLSQWTEAFPCRQAIASSVAKVLLEKIIPIWKTPLQLHSDQGTYFTGQVLWQVCDIWSILQHFHWAYHPQYSGLVKHTNGIILKIGKICRGPPNTLAKSTVICASKSQIHFFWNS